MTRGHTLRGLIELIGLLTGLRSDLFEAVRRDSGFILGGEPALVVCLSRTMAENHIEDDEYEEDMDLSECTRFSLFEILARRDDQDMAPALDFLERVVKIWRARMKSGENEEA